MLMYSFVALIAAIYTLIAAFVLVMTYDECCKTNNKNLLCNALSIVSCLLWPLTVLVVAVVSQYKTATRVST